jgi:hypothetical protein
MIALMGASTLVQVNDDDDNIHGKSSSYSSDSTLPTDILDQQDGFLVGFDTCAHTFSPRVVS